nr:ATP-binding cassette domain-containing protein [Protaetiibacter larvae]
MTTPLAVRPAAVRAHGWGWRHAGRRAWALAGLDLAIDPGERVLLLGASGSGKSTLLAGLAGVLGSDEDGERSGELLIDGVPAAAARGRVGLVLQDPESQVVMSRVGDDVAFGCENLGVPREETWRRVDAALAAVGLGLPREHPTERLSGGQKQRLVLAGVLAMRPGLILLDEPTAELDPAGVREVRDAVIELARTTGATLVVVEHRVDAWVEHVDRVVVLGAAGAIVADGAPDAVLSREGASLAAQGVWVPGHEPAPVAGPRPVDGERLLTAAGLAVARRPGVVVRGGIDLELTAGRAVALTGPNGSGKSTLALTLAGLLPAAAGVLRAEPALASGIGPDPARWRSRELLPRIGTVFQSPEHQFLARTVREEVALGPRALGRAQGEAEATADELLERLGLAPLAAANPFTLSGGQKRRLSVATVLATSPRLLVLDEPTFGQDARTWAELVALLDAQLSAGSAIVFATHDERLAAALGAAAFELAGVPA